LRYISIKKFGTKYISKLVSWAEVKCFLIEI
jgi:hypothetical protein